jgi:tRNA-splicing ligase RtcB
MNLASLQRIDDQRWTPTTHGAPAVVLFGSRELLAAMDDQVLEQIVSVSRLPGRVGPAMTLPDAHWGYGFPIGGVAAFDPAAGGVVSPGGVGFDIACGIRCLRTNLTLEAVAEHLPRLAEALYTAIPAGVGEEGDIRLAQDELEEVLGAGAAWAVARGYGVARDLEFIEDHGRVAGADPAAVSVLARQRQHAEMGTLGSGNHYIEVQVVDRILDGAAAQAFGVHEGQLLISIHSGSRGLGHQIGTDYQLAFARAAGRPGGEPNNRELACAPILSEEGQRYLGAIRAASNCALANRQILAHRVRETFARILPDARIETLCDISHNTCRAEYHEVDGASRLLYVHRKGATRALGPGNPDLPARYRATGQPLIVGGSMGTASWLLAGTGEPANRAYASSSHGAGRAMSRKQALRRWQGRELIAALARGGILIRTHSLRGAAEEAPGAYKDVDQVVEATESAGLARRIALLRPKVCIKG